MEINMVLCLRMHTFMALKFALKNLQEKKRENDEVWKFNAEIYKCK